MKLDDQDHPWLVVVFLGRLGDVPEFNLSRLMAFGLIDHDEAGPCITEHAIAEFR